MIKKIVFLFAVVFHLPHLLVFISRPNPLISADMDRYPSLNSGSRAIDFLWLMTYCDEFRAVFYYRIGYLRLVLQWFHPVRINLHIYTPSRSVDGGLRVQHGFSTAIAAKSIGKNLWVNQQVTIGYTNDHDAPVIGNDVSISAGAIVIGDVHIGDNSVIGAGAVVTKNVPPNCTVVGNPAYIIRRDGIKVRDEL